MPLRNRLSCGCTDQQCKPSGIPSVIVNPHLPSGRILRGGTSTGGGGSSTTSSGGTGTSGGSTTSGGTSTGGGSTTGGGSSTGGGCTPGAERYCYSGPPSTLGVGPCTMGIQACTSTGTWGRCLGEVIPQSVDFCNNRVDDNCNGVVDEGTPEICDGRDNDCDGIPDNGLSLDQDQDRHYLPGSCAQPADDCDDTRRDVYPGAPEICDGVDNTCVPGSERERFDRDQDGSMSAWDCSFGNDCDDLDPTVHPGAEEICDGKDNDCDGEVDEGCSCDLDVIAVPASVEPSGLPEIGPGIRWRTSTEILVYRRISLGEFVCEYEAEVIPDYTSGGHPRHSGERPRGTLSAYSFSLAPPQDTYTLTYTAPELSGSEEIVIHSILPGGTTRRAGSTTISVAVPNLEPLSEGSTYRLTGQTPMHEDNHYAIKDVIKNIKAIAQDFYEGFQATLGINDMSLPGGGLFDIYGNWAPPHNLHRIGKSADVDRNVYDFDTGKYILIPCEYDKILRTVVEEKRRGILICEYGGRKHIEFP